MRRKRMFVTSWLAATAAAVLVSSLAVTVVGARVSGVTIAPLSRQAAEDEVAGLDVGGAVRADDGSGGGLGGSIDGSVPRPSATDAPSPQPGDPTPTAGAGATTDPGAAPTPGGPSATVPGAAPVTTPSSSSGAPVGATPAPSTPAPTPSPTTTAAPTTAPPVSTRTFSGTGGSFTGTCSAAIATVGSVTPALLYSPNVKKTNGPDLDVEFTSPLHTTRIRVHCDAGTFSELRIDG